MALELDDHQITAIGKLSNGKILVGGTGVGKSRTAVGYYLQNEAPKDIYVITTAKKRDSLDWQTEFVAAGIYTSLDTTVAGVLHVDSWNNIEKYKDIKGAFFIFDEQRVVGGGAWSQRFIKLTRNNAWILLSATPGDTWLDYIPVFVANGFYKNRTDFKNQHCEYSYYGKYPQLKRYHNVNKLVRLRNSILVEMPYVRGTVRHTTFVAVDYDKELMEICQKKRWNVFTQKPLKDVGELFRVSRKIANTHVSRLEQVKTLLDRHPKVIVFYNFDYELEILRSLISTQEHSSLVEQNDPSQEKNSKAFSDSRSRTTSGTSSNESSKENDSILPSSFAEPIHTLADPFSFQKGLEKSTLKMAEWNGHKHEPIPEGESWVYLVQYMAGAEGWNCIRTDAMVFYSLPYSYKNWHQAFGRIDRMNTPYLDLWYYILKSDSWIDQHIWKALSQKKNFNESSSGVKW